MFRVAGCPRAWARRWGRPCLGGPGPSCCGLRGGCDPGHPVPPGGNAGASSHPRGTLARKVGWPGSGKEDPQDPSQLFGLCHQLTPTPPPGGWEQSGRARPAAKMRIQGVLWLSRLSQKRFHAGRPERSVALSSPGPRPRQDSAHRVINGPGFVRRPGGVRRSRGSRGGSETRWGQSCPAEGQASGLKLVTGGSPGCGPPVAVSGAEQGG